MLCSCGGQTIEGGHIIDIDRVLQDYAWRELKRDSRWYHLLRRSDYIIEVPWNYFEFEHTTIKFNLRYRNTNDGFREKKQVELFSTDYCNNSGKEQLYKLKTNRQTKASTTVTCHPGFTIKGNTNFRLKIPQKIGNCGITSSVDGYMHVTKPKGETFEEILTWEVDSDITVEPNQLVNVTLVVTEEELLSDFQVKTTLRMPSGEAPIIIRRRRDKQIYAVLVVSDLSDPFSEVECSVVNMIKNQEDTKKPYYIIEFVSSGILECIRWKDQRICLESQPIDFTRGALGVDIPLYSKEIFSRVLQHATKEEIASFEEPDNISETEEAVYSEVAKELRFNIIPTIITEVHDEPVKEAPKLPPKTTFNMPTKIRPKLTDIVEEQTVKVKAETTPEDEKVMKLGGMPVLPPISKPFEFKEEAMKVKLKFIEDNNGDGKTKTTVSEESRMKVAEKPLVTDLPEKELSREDSLTKQEERGTQPGTPDSLDSQKFSKVTSV